MTVTRSARTARSARDQADPDRRRRRPGRRLHRHRRRRHQAPAKPPAARRGDHRGARPGHRRRPGRDHQQGRREGGADQAGRRPRRADQPLVLRPGVRRQPAAGLPDAAVRGADRPGLRARPAAGDRLRQDHHGWHQPADPGAAGRLVDEGHRLRHADRHLDLLRRLRRRTGLGAAGPGLAVRHLHRGDPADPGRRADLQGRVRHRAVHHERGRTRLRPGGRRRRNRRRRRQGHPDPGFDDHPVRRAGRGGRRLARRGRGRPGDRRLGRVRRGRRPRHHHAVVRHAQRRRHRHRADGRPDRGHRHQGCRHLRQHLRHDGRLHRHLGDHVRAAGRVLVPAGRRSCRTRTRRP